MDTNPPFRGIRAKYTQSTITVYQAYSPEIAEPALRAGTFVPPFKRERMTWIKPSFLWMAYRSGWASKPRQERILAIEITREGFEWTLAHSCLSNFEPGVYADRGAWEKRKEASPVRVQWDPERDFDFRPLGYRSIQIGLSGEAVDKYVDEWIVSVTDVTVTMKSIHLALAEKRLDEAMKALPEERPYPLPEELKRILGAT